MKTLLAILGLGALFATAAAADPIPPEKEMPKAAAEPEAKRDAKEAPLPRIQLAILLDTSNSMDGLIEQAKGQLWKVVNEFISANKGGRRPQLEVALYEYGKASLPAETGYIRRILPLTTDLDKVSEELFALKTNGGDEYCGWVIGQAVKELSWSDAPGDYKVIFIAGNEPFTQGKVDYRESCKAAAGRGITVNTIHCGTEAEGVNGKWKDGAVLADGTYSFIDHNRAVVNIVAPQDKKIAELGAKLNETYVAYGKAGEEASTRQKVQDANAAKTSSGSFIQRSVTKANPYYVNAGWDLVDAVNQNQVKLAEVKEADLPENMRRMNAAERQAFVDGKLQERRRIQNDINALNLERQKHVDAEMKKQADAKGVKTLDAAMSDSLRAQAARKEFTIEAPKAGGD
jgi:hypothetical protein